MIFDDGMLFRLNFSDYRLWTRVGCGVFSSQLFLIRINSFKDEFNLKMFRKGLLLHMPLKLHQNITTLTRNFSCSSVRRFISWHTDYIYIFKESKRSGGGDSHFIVKGMLDVSLWGLNSRLWSHFNRVFGTERHYIGRP